MKARSTLITLTLLAACTVQAAPAPAPPPPQAEAEGDVEAGGGADFTDEEMAAADAVEAAGEAQATVDAEFGTVDSGESGPAEPPSEPAPRGNSDLEPEPPVVCNGSQEIRLVGKSIDTGGHAIDLRGSCDVLIERSHIRAGGVAIKISGSADVTIRDSVVEGRRAAVMISGSGTVRARRTRFLGRKVITGSGDFQDGGGNRWR